MQGRGIGTFWRDFFVWATLATLAAYVVVTAAVAIAWEFRYW